MNATLLLKCAVMGLVIGSVACGGWYDKDESSPTAPSVLGALRLSPASAAIPADGFSTTPITATVSANAALTRRVVVFRTTRGTFVGSGATETDTIEQTVDSQNSTRVELRSSRTVETARVTATVKDVAGLMSNEVVVSFTAAPPGDAIRIIAVNSAPADGASITQMTAEISGGLPAGRRTVTFSTNLGKFVGSNTVTNNGTQVTADADGGNRAIAYLESPSDSLATAFVTAKVDSSPTISAQATVQFVRAKPQRVLVTANSPTVAPNFTQTIKVTAKLVRDVGIPTQGTVVTFKAVDSGGVERGIFTNVKGSDANGEVTVDFAAGTGAALGPMTITATAEGESGSTIVQVQ